jgi:hypothetical protein
MLLKLYREKTNTYDKAMRAARNPILLRNDLQLVRFLNANGMNGSKFCP